MADVRNQYESEFHSGPYVKDFINSGEYELQWFVEDFYHDLFSKGKISGKTLIDVGCGPTNRAAVVASRYGCEVYSADLVEENINFVKNWLKNGHDAFDLTAQFKHVAQLEGQSDIKYLEERVKKSVKDVFYCDILAENPLHPRLFEQFDIVTSSLCLDCYPDEKDYLKGAKGIASLVRPGGHVAFSSSIGGTFYYNGETRLPSANVDGAKGREVLTRAGLKVLEVCEYYLKGEIPCNTDVAGFFTIYAIKE